MYCLYELPTGFALLKVVDDGKYKLSAFKAFKVCT